MAEKGVTDEVLEREFGVDKNAIRQRRFNDKKKGSPWITPKELELEERKKALERHFKGKKNSGTEGGGGMDLVPVTDQEMVQLRDENPKLFARKIGSLLLEGLALLKIPTSAQEWVSLHNAYRKALGMDQGGGVNVLIGSGMNWSSQKGEGHGKPVIEIASEP